MEVAKRSVKDFADDDMTTYAAALAFRVLLALFPFAIFLLTLLGALGLPGFFDRLVEQAATALPRSAAGMVEQVIGEVRGQARSGLLSFGIAAAVWSASSAVRSLMKALNAAYDVDESRPAWRRFALSIAYTIGLAVMLIAAAGLMLVGPQAAEWLAGQLGFGGLALALWTWLRWPVAALLLLLAVALVYYAAPNVDQPIRFITPGAVLAVVVWIVASLGFSYYVSNFGSYGATYGSLGGVVVMLLYFFISAMVLLLGAEVNATIHHATEGRAPAARGG
jgi:membrane protein